jgi:tetratricopeptide (TPR) repeat protein
VAIADYTKAIELDPRNPAFYNSRGRAYQQLGDMSGATADFDKAIETDPKFAASYINRGYLLKAAGKLDEAIGMFSKAIEADRDNKTFLYARAEALIEQGKSVEAIRDYDLALRLDPTDPYLYLARSQARTAVGNLRGALDDVNRALLVDGKLPAAYATRSAIYARLGEAENAEADKQRVVATLAVVEEAKRRLSSGPTNVRVTIVGKFNVVPNYLRPFELGTTIEVRGDRISYQTPQMPLYTMQSGETFEEKFFGTCSGQTTTNQGERFVTASLDKDLLHIQLRSRLDFTTGACRGRYNYYSETFLIDLYGGKCKFDYLQKRNLFGVGEFDNRIADQACVVATIP